jgi:hypothetical protein
MNSNLQIADRLREEKRTISAFAYTLRLLLPQSTSSIDDDERRICAWVDDAIEALSRIPQETVSPK